MLELILYFGPVILVVLLVLLIITEGYVKAPPDHAYIISGLRKEPRVLVGRAGLKLPFFEQLDKLYLGQITVDIKTDEYIPTNDFINVMVDAVAKVRVADDPAMLKLAMRNFLNKNSAKIAADLQDSLQGNMREIIGTLTLRAINTDRDSFSDQVMAKASKDMEKLGIEILSCNIQNVTDEHGLIQDLGMDNTSKIRKDASIAKAEAERDIAIAQAAADKASNEARVLAETEIAQKNNELAIKKAELQKASDTKKAEADAAYEIQKQEQQNTIQAATVNAQLAKAEREAELRRQEVAVQQQALEAEINKKADADRYAIEQAAAADLTRRQREAEAKKYEQEKELDTDSEKWKELLDEYAKIEKYLEEKFLEKGNEKTYRDMVELIIQIADYVFRDKEKVRKGFGDVMGGKVLELESDRLIKQGLEQGFKRGVEQGIAMERKKTEAAEAEIRRLKKLLEEQKQ